MSTLDIIYLLMLILSIPYGHAVKSVQSAALKQMLCLGAGLFIVLSLVGVHAIYHSLLVIIVNYVILKFVSHRYCHVVSFLLIFGYLLFFRVCGYLGFKAPPKHSNAVQLLVTLRMVSLAFEKREDVLKTAKTEQTSSTRIEKELSTSFLDILTYGYCYIGLMTGPFYTYKTFTDMLHQDGKKISTVLVALRNLKLVPLLAVPYLYLKEKFPQEYLESEDFLNHESGFVYSLVIITLTSTWFRWRFFIGWMLAESGCIAASLGAYPFASKPKPGKGPTVPPEEYEEVEIPNKDETHSFETINNIVISDIEFAPSMKAFIKGWNTTVQWWLAYYTNILTPDGMSRGSRTFIVFTVSAYWHGTHIGYYFMAVLVATYAQLEARLNRVAKQRLTQAQEYIFSWFTLCMFSVFQKFIIVSFMLLKFDKIYPVWKSLYFCGFIILICQFLLPFLLKLINNKRNGKENGVVDDSTHIKNN